MRTLLITIAGVIVLAGGGAGYVYATHNASQSEAEESPVSEVNVNDENEDSLTGLPESEELEDIIDGDDFNIEVVKDNDEKRILVLKDDENNQQYKSIYIKKKDWLKVIEFDKGLIFNEQIGDTNDDDSDNDKEATKDEKKEEEKAEDTKDKESSDSDLEEYSTLEKEVNMDDLQTDVVEDNSNKRVMLLKDEDGKKEYKSVYVKHKDFIKVIDLDGGLVYKGKIK